MGRDGSTRWGGHRRRPCVNEWTYTLAAAAFAQELRGAHPLERLFGYFTTTPGGPCGMHWRTYERHAAAYDAANARREARCLSGLVRLLASIERRGPHRARGRR